MFQLAAAAFFIATGVGLITLNDNQAQDMHAHGLHTSAHILSATPCPIGRYESQSSGIRLTVQFTDNTGKIRTAQSLKCVSTGDGNATTIWYQADDPQTIVTREDLPVIAKSLHDTQALGYVAFAIVGAVLIWRAIRLYRA